MSIMPERFNSTSAPRGPFGPGQHVIGRTSPTQATIPGPPPRGMPCDSLADMQANYLAARRHTLSIDGMPLHKAAPAQAEYVKGEACELVDAVDDLFAPANVDVMRMVRHEIADVVLATVTLANLLGVTVEECIAEKTEADRGRG